MPPPIFSTSESLRAAHDALVSALTPTVPTVLHGSGGDGGSGGADPSAVDAATVHLVADLTATYVGQLVDAAVEAHDVLTDGAGGIRPPPNFPRDDHHPNHHNSHSRAVSARRNSCVSMATVKQQQSDGVGVGMMGGGGNQNNNNNNKRTRRSDDRGTTSAAAVVPGSIDDCWDDVEVPLPKVRKTQATQEGNTSKSSAANKPAAGATSSGTTPTTPKSVLLPSTKTTSTDQDNCNEATWAGLAGVDLFGPRRRVPYAGPPYTIETKSFIFPICHDPTLYGRIMEVQKARRTIAPLLVDPIMRDLVRSEGREVVRAIEAGRRLGEGEALVVGGAGSGGAAGGAGGGSGTASDGGGGGGGGASAAAASAAAAATSAAGAGGDDGADTEIEKDSAIMALRNGVADGAVWPGLSDVLPTYTTKTLLGDADNGPDGNGGRKRKTQRVSFASKDAKNTS